MAHIALKRYYHTPSFSINLELNQTFLSQGASEKANCLSERLEYNNDRLSLQVDSYYRSTLIILPLNLLRLSLQVDSRYR